jgi:hypothetical protein
LSKLAKYVLRPAASRAEWDWIVANSPQGTLFSESVYLDACGRDYDQIVICQGNQIKAGLCMIRGADERSCELDDLVIHNGLLFVHDDTKKFVRARAERFDVTQAAIDFLDTHYDNVELALSPAFEDMRPFLWHHYHEADMSLKYKLDLRYTSYLDISGLIDEAVSFEETKCFRAMETLRQRHVRDAIRRGAKVTAADGPSRLISFYQALMENQGQEASPDKLHRMTGLIGGLVAAERAAVYEVVNEKSAVVYTVVYGWDAKRAYYLFGAGHPEQSESYQGTFAHWSAFLDLAGRRGVREVDLEGTNSPQRGWFKLSFGGKLLPYYEVSLGRRRGIAS